MTERHDNDNFVYTKGASEKRVPACEISFSKDDMLERKRLKTATDEGSELRV